MALGFIYDGSSAYARPDRGMGRNVTPRVNIAKFGDGYEQRVLSGINHNNESYSVAFNNRTKAFIDDLVKFLNGNLNTPAQPKSVFAFNFTIPDTNESGNEKTIKVVCDTFDVSYSFGDFYSLTATFRRVYE